MTTAAPPRWGLQYQAWRIQRLQQLLPHMTRKQALEQLASEEIEQPWRNTPPLPALNTTSPPPSGLFAFGATPCDTPACSF